jgi:AcrR family transcriptional regulator
MPDVKPTRRDRAALTRSRIIEAAHGEFVEHGYAGATMASIARRAGVAPQTVYFVFHTKPDLISAVVDTAVVGTEDVPPDRTTWWQEMLADPNPVSALRRFVRGAAPSFERASAISVVLAAAALTDEELRSIHDRHEQLRRHAFRTVVESLAGKGALRAGLDVTLATDVLLTVFGDHTYHLLRVQRGWGEEQVVSWLSEVLPDLLLHRGT